MKLLQLLLFAILLFYKSTVTNADSYYFDYKLVYQVTNAEKPANNYKKSYYINSKDNSYVGKLMAMNDTEVEYMFIDQNGYSARVIIQPAQIPLIDTVGITVSSLNVYENPYKFQVDNFNFFRLADTIINEKKLSRFWLKCSKSKLQQRKKFWSMIFMVDESVSFKPLLTHATAYEIWKKRHNIPDGLLTQLDNYNEAGKLVSSEKLISMDTLNISMKLENDR
jgi:DNA-dependent RNA polymerase auxiliary subunit epsilon